MQPTIPGQDTEHATFCARRNQARRRRFRIYAAVARPAGSAEDAYLAIEAKNGTVDVGLAEQDRCVVHQIAGGEIVGAVDDHVVIAKQFERVFAGQWVS
jgi:hypothetical protein